MSSASFAHIRLILVGYKYDLPEGYTALSLVLSAEEAIKESASPFYRDAEQDENDDGDSDDNTGGKASRRRINAKQHPPGKRWTAMHSSPSITLWGHDAPPTRADPGRRALDFLLVASRVHATVTPEQVAEKLQLIMKA